ncbi:MAG TPA: RidA family protein [Bryobacteraceae bacterium]|nr:RidA family protein [Bryobacteraceae bacterium]HPT27346.1 RidA family protein [Bryobacteraceae bacterium]
MRTIRTVCTCLLCLALAAPAQRKKDEEPETQSLLLPPDPPAVLRAETARLEFGVVPMNAKGLLSQQAREQVKWVLSRYGKERVIKIRAFVAGSGDLRRVQAVVSEMFSEKRVSLPVLSVVQVGALPVTGAQIQMEVTVETHKTANPHGLAFISGQLVQSDQDTAKTPFLARESLARVKTALEAAGESAAATRRITCFLSAIDGAAEIQQFAASLFPKTPLTLVQVQRANAKPLAECEAVAALSRTPGQTVARLNPASLAQTTRYTHVLSTNASHLIFAGAQLAFNYEDADAKLAFERLNRTLISAGSNLKHTVMIDAYPLSQTLAELVRKYWFDFLDQAAPPASLLMVLEGLPSMDAAFALEVVARPAEVAQ